MEFDYDTLSAGYARSSMTTGFFDRFYEIFLAKSPEIAPLFKDTDFVKQKAALQLSIAYLLSFVSGMEFGREGLDQMAEVHSRRGRNIDPDLYPHWLDSLCETLAEHDPDWSPDLERQWRAAMQRGIDHIVAAY